MLPTSMPFSSRAESMLGKISGSARTNFTFAMRTPWLSSDLVYDGFVPVLSPPAPMMARMRIGYKVLLKE